MDSSGHIVNRVIYSNLGICRGTPEPFNTGGSLGVIRYVVPYLLCGTIDNIGSDQEPGMIIRFTATNCAGDSAIWSVIVNTGPLGPGERYPFNKRIGYSDPGSPCKVSARAYR